MGSMTHTPGRLALALCLLAPGWSGLAACGLLDGSSRVEEALEYLPAGATSVTFVDRAALEDRDGEPYAAPLTIDARVEWKAFATTGDDTVRVWKLDDDTDFDALADALKNTPEGDAVRLVPDERLAVAGDVDTAVAVAGDDEDSLADDGSYADLLDEAPDQDGLEFAGMTLEAGCGPAALFVVTDDVVRAHSALGPDASTEDTAFADRATAYAGWVARSGIFACD